jgi:hypothetical protein
MEREESGSSREHHLPPVKDESVIRVSVRPLHGISAAGNEPAPGVEGFELADLVRRRLLVVSWRF